VAAFCRGLGIPARVVWGCVYIPDRGGLFAQHGWNEVYMGEAGWIPLDSTLKEFEVVDSGHIRLGVHQSTATGANPRNVEVLDHRIGPADAARKKN
jgi:transglutaminase-like putative cysteine protease